MLFRATMDIMSFFQITTIHSRRISNTVPHPRKSKSIKSTITEKTISDGASKKKRTNMDHIQKRWSVACRRLILSHSNGGKWNGQFISFDPWRPSDLTRWLQTQTPRQTTLKPIQLSQYEYDRWLSNRTIRRLLTLALQWFVSSHPLSFDGSPEDYRTLL
jgi:hypothetical protein